jgi:phospholipid transport system substrate-binding protein
MRNIFVKILMVLSMLVFVQNVQAGEREELKQHFVEELDTIIKIIENKEFSKDERNAKIVAELTPMFDFKLMAKLSLGKKAWQKLDKNQQKKFVDLYVERMKDSYSSKIDSYENEKINITNIKRKKNRISLETEVQTDEKNLIVVYKFYKPKKRKKDKDKWLIYDVEIIGISILKADKAQFKEYLRTHTIEELMQELTKTKKQ